jgi:hypothetical protein
MDEILEIYDEYCVVYPLIDFPISGNYTKEQFPEGVASLLHMYEKNILLRCNKNELINEPNIIFAIGSGNINIDTNCEQYTILCVPLSKVTGVLITIYDDIEDIYSELIQMYTQLSHNTLSFVFAISLGYDYTCIFQTNL